MNKGLNEIKRESSFSDEEINELQDALKDYDQENIDWFRSLLEVTCGLMKMHLTMPSPSEQIEDLRDIQKSFDRTIDNTYRLGLRYKIGMEDFYTKLDEIPWDDDEAFEYKKLKSFFKISELARLSLFTLIDMIDETIKRIEKQKPPKAGRPRADDINFVKQIADTYSDTIDNPTTYKDGPFAQVVRVALKHVGLPYKDPRRSIAKAVKEAPPSLVMEAKRRGLKYPDSREDAEKVTDSTYEKWISEIEQEIRSQFTPIFKDFPDILALMEEIFEEEK
jgi:hypothetical protein